jgi:hypothetical protein
MFASPFVDGSRTAQETRCMAKMQMNDSATASRLFMA